MVSTLSQHQRIRRSSSSTQTLPDDITDELIAEIFVGELKPGEQLPPDRLLAQQLGVDRTSLRMALRQLSRMKLVRSVRGSGVTVLDYREHAGMDFLAAVFSLPDVELGGTFQIEVLDHWIEVMPWVVATAIKRATHEDYRSIDLLFTRQLELLDNGSDNAEVTEVELELQRLFAKLVGSIVAILLANNTLPLRRKLVRMLLDNVDPKGHVESHRALFGAAIKGKLTPDAISTGYRAFLVDQTKGLRDRLSELPPNPTRKTNESAAEEEK